MKRFNTLFYLLFVLLILGAFAAMAQNDYGLVILGLVAFVFSAIFFVQMILILSEKRSDEEKTDVGTVIEMGALCLLSGILAMRVFYIHFQFVEVVFGGAGLLLIIVYVRKLLQRYQMTRSRSKALAFLVLVFHSSIILYISSMISVAFLPTVSEPAGGVAFALLLGFIGLGFMRKEIMLGSEKVTAFNYVLRFRDASTVLITLFFLFTGFMGLTKIGVLPKMYSDEFPQVYFKMVNDAETGKEEAVDGKYKHEKFKEKYDEFVSRQRSSDKK